MTNTKNTPIEALERAYGMRVLRYRLRRGSGGAGRCPGGEGIERDLIVAVASSLHDHGIWLSFAGSADGVDPPGAREALSLPRLSVRDISEAVEDHFEVLRIERSAYGTTPGVTDFAAFSCAFRRR